MKLNISAIVFDIDGTLYPSWRFSIKILPFILKNFKLMLAFNKTRNKIRQYQKEDPNFICDDFFDFQAKILAEYLKTDFQTIKEFLEKKIYFGWRSKFATIKPYYYVMETILKLKEQGLKIGILSDFIPEQKGNIWGILPLCDITLGAEKVGALKPSKIVFKKLAENLQLPSEKILYVGNNFKYDILGAKSVGMHTAYISPPPFIYLKRLFCHKKADIYFSNYKQLLKFLL